jgi:hypothetical protein
MPELDARAEAFAARAQELEKLAFRRSHTVTAICNPAGLYGAWADALTGEQLAKTGPRPKLFAMELPCP